MHIYPGSSLQLTKNYKMNLDLQSMCTLQAICFPASVYTQVPSETQKCPRQLGVEVVEEGTQNKNALHAFTSSGAALGAFLKSFLLIFLLN